MQLGKRLNKYYDFHLIKIKVGHSRYAPIRKWHFHDKVNIFGQQP